MSILRPVAMGELQASLRYFRCVAGILLATASLACEDTSNQPPAPIQVALALPSGWSLIEIGWVVQAADGSTLATGTQDVGVPQDTLSLSLLLPVGEGDVLYLDAVTTSGVLCNGASAPFDVVNGQPGAIDVPMSCQTSGYSPSGCPDILVQGPTPPAAATGGAVSIVATSSAFDGTDVPSCTWVATGGVLSDTIGGSTRYTCSVVGSQTVVLTVNEPVLPGCSTTFLLPVTCLP